VYDIFTGGSLWHFHTYMYHTPVFFPPLFSLCKSALISEGNLPQNPLQAISYLYLARIVLYTHGQRRHKPREWEHHDWFLFTSWCRREVLPLKHKAQLSWVDILQKGVLVGRREWLLVGNSTSQSPNHKQIAETK
jgi:hypothetical protein